MRWGPSLFDHELLPPCNAKKAFRHKVPSTILLLADFGIIDLNFRMGGQRVQPRLCSLEERMVKGFGCTFGKEVLFKLLVEVVAKALGNWIVALEQMGECFMFGTIMTGWADVWI